MNVQWGISLIRPALISGFLPAVGHIETACLVDDGRRGIYAPCASMPIGANYCAGVVMKRAALFEVFSTNRANEIIQRHTKLLSCRTFGRGSTIFHKIIRRLYQKNTSSV